MRSIAFTDFLVGVGILCVLEGLMFAASPAWMRRAMKSALATPDNILRIVGIVSAGGGLFLMWIVPREQFVLIPGLLPPPGRRPPKGRDQPVGPPDRGAPGARVFPDDELQVPY